MIHDDRKKYNRFLPSPALSCIILKSAAGITVYACGYNDIDEGGKGDDLTYDSKNDRLVYDHVYYGKLFDKVRITMIAIAVLLLAWCCYCYKRILDDRKIRRSWR
ncbi:MAG: hypothetical protein JXR97_11040 [Planctomycetes bacterium]|nr:hypothetical protein [Planctomycetota bacterium]